MTLHSRPAARVSNAIQPGQFNPTMITPLSICSAMVQEEVLLVYLGIEFQPVHQQTKAREYTSIAMLLVYPFVRRISRFSLPRHTDMPLC